MNLNLYYLSSENLDIMTKMDGNDLRQRRKSDADWAETNDDHSSYYGW